ncbi:MAG TPA: hypothetical protein VK432_00690 [Stellaceae bacterium]|nr:hypothetical protein [Stellaceae bacterium]
MRRRAGFPHSTDLPPRGAAAPTTRRHASGRPEHSSPRGLYGYIWATSGRAQILLALLSVFIFLLDLAPLELQRRIVNDAISQKAFALMAWLCGVYVVTAAVQGLAKLAWNAYRNTVGEATSRRLRRETFAASRHHPQPEGITKEGVGTVVAFISGLTKVNDPWNDLVTFLRDMTNARVKYRLIAGVVDDQDPGEDADEKTR